MPRPITDYFTDNNLRKSLKTASFKKGESILRPYEDSKYIYAIDSGLVRLYTTDTRSTENIAVIYGPGDLFPLAWIINAERPSVDVRAQTSCKLQLIPRDLFQNMLQENHDMALDLMNRIVEQMALFASTLNNLGLKYGKERLAYRLLVLAARFGKKQGEVTVIPHLSHSDLGATINMKRESVNREITRLENLGVIEYGRSGITIKDPGYLQIEIGIGMPVIFFDNF